MTLPKGTRFKRRSSIRNVAFHEAGHAVLIEKLGARVRRVEVFNGKRGETVVTTDHFSAAEAMRAGEELIARFAYREDSDAP